MIALTMDEALTLASRLADELSAGGIRWRITLDDGDGQLAQLVSDPRPKVLR